METTTDILTELTSISPLIAAMKKVNIFTVPQGYFEHVSTTILACISEEQTIVNYLPDNVPAEVPAGYFDQLADSILNKIKATETAADELRNLSPMLFAIQNKNVFEIPEGYFETVNSIVIDKIKTATAKEELKEISPLLYSLKSKQVFEAPNGYFTNLANNILRETSSTTNAKVVVMHKRGLWVKYAVAAMITGAMALGIYKYIDNTGTGIASNNSVANLDATIEKGKNMNDQQFNETLGNLTQADIAKYLEKNGDIADVAVLRNNLEEGNLPAQEDYLMDETTLDRYLKEIEKTTINN